MTPDTIKRLAGLYAYALQTHADAEPSEADVIDMFEELCETVADFASTLHGISREVDERLTEAPGDKFATEIQISLGALACVRDVPDHAAGEVTDPGDLDGSSDYPHGRLTPAALDRLRALFAESAGGAS